MGIQAVVFDLGGTLIEYAGPYAGWPALETPGFVAAYEHLARHGTVLPPFEHFRDTGFGMLPGRWQAATRGVRNLRLIDLLDEALQACRVNSYSPALLDAAAQRYERAICDQAHPLEDAQAMLATLRACGYRLGLISNTMFRGAAHVADLRRFGLDGYFDALLFSADENKWKPNMAPFAHVLEALGVDAETAVFIGDDPANDVVGAQRAGMRAIHIRSSQRFTIPQGVQPDATITHLRQLPDLLAVWQGQAA